MKKCKNCSKEFVPKTVRAQFCSDNCRVNFGRWLKRSFVKGYKPTDEDIELLKNSIHTTKDVDGIKIETGGVILPANSRLAQGLANSALCEGFNKDAEPIYKIGKMIKGKKSIFNYPPKPTKEEVINSIPGVKTAAEIPENPWMSYEEYIKLQEFKADFMAGRIPLSKHDDQRAASIAHATWEKDVMDYCQEQSITPEELIQFHRTKGNKPEKKKRDVPLSKEGEARQAAEKGHYDRRKNKLGF